MARKLYELSQLENTLLESPTFPSRIAALRIAYPNIPDSTLRGLLKRQDIADLFDKPTSDVVLVIGDTHAPFTLAGYLEHCQNVYKGEGCTRVVHIGDVVGNHRASFHPDELDALNADDELDAAIKVLKPWGEAFPNVDALMGNHDLNIHRKATASGVSHRWIKPYNEVLGLSWCFHNELHIDGVMYRHNVGSSPQAAATTALDAGQPVVGGHIHSKAGVVHAGKVWGMITGIGVDRKWYDQRYASGGKRYQISCAVVYHGKRGAIFPMDI